MERQRDLPCRRRGADEQANELGGSTDVKQARARADGGLAHAYPGIVLTSPFLIVFSFHTRPHSRLSLANVHHQ